MIDYHGILWFIIVFADCLFLKDCKTNCTIMSSKDKELLCLFTEDIIDKL